MGGGEPTFLTDRKRIKARLDAAARRWDWEDRRSGRTTFYRGTSPHRQARRRRPAISWRQFGLEVAMIVGAMLFFWFSFALLLSY